jgi:ferric-dicitrate binding protein FerR (iron transport regulator)
VTPRPVVSVLQATLQDLAQQTEGSAESGHLASDPEILAPPCGSSQRSSVFSARRCFRAWAGAALSTLALVAACGLLISHVSVGYDPFIHRTSPLVRMAMLVTIGAAAIATARWLQKPLTQLWNRILFGNEVVRALRALNPHQDKPMAAEPLDWARFLWLCGTVGAALFLVVMQGWPTPIKRAESLLTRSYSTGIGEIRTVALPDGSKAYLNTKTRLQWTASDSDRRVVLLEGEALFDVIHRPDAPFRVIADRGEIEDLGTSFDVYRKTDGTVVVTVVSGVVKVEDLQGVTWKRKLAENQQVVYAGSGVTQDVRQIRASDVITWREGRLEFKGERLSTIVRELNRYSTKRIVLTDRRLNDLWFGGATTIDRIPDFLQSLPILYPLSVEVTDDAIILSYRADLPHTAEQSREPR